MNTLALSLALLLCPTAQAHESRPDRTNRKQWTQQEIEKLNRKRQNLQDRMRELQERLEDAESDEQRAKIEMEMDRVQYELHETGAGRVPPGKINEAKLNRMREELMKFLQEELPEAARNLKALVELHPDEGREVTLDLYHRTRDMRKMEAHAPEFYEIKLDELGHDVKIRLLSYRLTRKGHEGDREKLKVDLRKALSELFDVRVKMRELEVQELEKRIEEVRGRLRKQKANKTKIIDRRLKEMSGEEEDLEFP